MNGKDQKNQQKKQVRKWGIAAVTVLVIAIVFPIVPLATDGIPYDIGFFGGFSELEGRGDAVARTNTMSLAAERDLYEGLGEELVVDCNCSKDDEEEDDGEATAPRSLGAGGVVILGLPGAPSRSSAGSYVAPDVVITLTEEVSTVLKTQSQSACTCVSQKAQEAMSQIFLSRPEVEQAAERYGHPMINSAPLYMTLKEFYDGKAGSIEIRCTCPGNEASSKLRMLMDQNGNIDPQKLSLACTCAERAKSDPTIDLKHLDWVEGEDGDVVTRGMFLEALAQAGNVDATDYSSLIFSDVSIDDRFLSYVVWAAKTNLVTGVGGSLFEPNEPITREQMAVILYNFINENDLEIETNKKIRNFKDKNLIHRWAADSVRVMQKAGVISGGDGNLFDPQGVATKEEAERILLRFMEKARPKSA
jgi:hypothetical protein